MTRASEKLLSRVSPNPLDRPFSTYKISNEAFKDTFRLVSLRRRNIRNFQLYIESGIFRGASEFKNFHFSVNFTEIRFVVSSGGSNN